MKDEHKRKDELIRELGQFRQRLAELEKTATRPKQAEDAVRESEEAVRESEEKYRSLVESTADSIYLVERACGYLFIKKKHLSRFGLPQKKVLRRT